MSKLFILTLSWNGEDKLIKLHNSLIPCLKNIEYSFHIKDNGSTDKSIEVASQWNNTKVISYPNNLQNYSEGMNLLFNQCEAKDEDYILFLNNDIIFNDTTSIHNMINLMEKDPKIGIVGARLLYTGTNKLQHAGVVFNIFNQFPINYRSKQESDDASKLTREFQAVTGALMLVKAGDYKKVMLDEQYHWCFEDIAFSLSVKYKLNKKIIYCGNTNVSHQESATLRINPRNKLFLNHNLGHFTRCWGGRYFTDQLKYQQDPNYNLYTGPK